MRQAEYTFPCLPAAFLLYAAAMVLVTAIPVLWLRRRRLSGNRQIR